MSKLYIKRFFKNKIAIFVIIAITIFRVSQYIQISDTSLHHPSFIDWYYYFNSINFLSLFQIPLYLFLSIQSFKLLFDYRFILYSSNKLNWLKNYCQILCFHSLFYSILINLSSFIAISTVSQYTPNTILHSIASVILQFLFQIVCELLFLLFSLFLRRLYLPYFIVVLYSLWDYMIGFTNISLPTIGSQFAIVGAHLLPQAFFSQLIYFMCIIGVLIFICIWRTNKMDFLYDYGESLYD